MSLKNYFAESTHPDKGAFDRLLDEIYFHTGFCSYITHFKSGRFYHTSPSFELITGYPTKQFEEEGVDFFVKRIAPENTLSILKAHAEFLAKAREPDFNPFTPFILDMTMRLPKPDGRPIDLIGSGAPIVYRANREIDFLIMIVYPKAGDDLMEKKMNSDAWSLLTRVKLLYHKIYTNGEQALEEARGPIEIVAQTAPKHILTAKEKEVLQLIAQGSSSREIGISLSISENTVESHRKNMLEKFEAKNTAELITKATKLYWLE